MGNKGAKVATLDPNAKDVYGYTALHRAIFDTDIATVTALLATPDVDATVGSRG